MQLVLEESSNMNQQLERDQLNAAILASQAEQERVRRKKQEEERSLSKSGDVKTFYSDSILISKSSIINTILDIVVSLKTARASKLREVVCELLELERKSVKWYREPARCYARKLARDLDGGIRTTVRLKGAINILTTYVTQLREVMFSMPDVPGAAPRAFASAYDDPVNRENEEEEEDDDVILLLDDSSPSSSKKKEKKRKKRALSEDITTKTSSKRSRRNLEDKKKKKQDPNKPIVANQAVWQFLGDNGKNDWIDMDSLCVSKLEYALSQNKSSCKLTPMGFRNRYVVGNINEKNKPMFQRNNKTGYERAVRRLMSVYVPAHVKPGETFKVQYKKHVFLLPCPQVSAAGSYVRFAVPTHP